jgi:capsular polysaccharide biosynthesis protein
VQSSAERASEESGADYWTTASLLDLAVVRGSQAEAQQLAYQLWSKANSPWEIDTTVQNLRLLSEAKGFGGETPEWLRDLITSLALAGS